MTRKINLIAFDYDACLSRKANRSPAELAHPECWLLADNELFLKHQLARIKKEEYDRVIIVQGSARQSNDIDGWGISKHGNGSCTAVLPILQSWFASQLKCEVVADPVLLADVFGQHKTAGDAFKAILRKLPPDQHDKVNYDYEKFMLMYMHAHRTALLNPDAEIMMDFFDDRPEILDHLYKVFNENKHLLPRNLTLSLHRYDGQDPKQDHYEDNLRPPIEGAGKPDDHYEWSLRYLGATTSAEPADIKNADELTQYHAENKYSSYAERQLEIPHPQQSFEQFVAFRDGPEMAKLSSEAAITKTKSYTTAQALCDEGLIPAHYVITDPELVMQTAKDAAQAAKAAAQAAAAKKAYEKFKKDLPINLFRATNEDDNLDHSVDRLHEATLGSGYENSVSNKYLAVINTLSALKDHLNNSNSSSSMAFKAEVQQVVAGLWDNRISADTIIKRIDGLDTKSSQLADVPTVVLWKTLGSIPFFKPAPAISTLDEKASLDAFIKAAKKVAAKVRPQAQ